MTSVFVMGTKSYIGEEKSSSVSVFTSDLFQNTDNYTCVQRLTHIHWLVEVSGPLQYLKTFSTCVYVF